jgi:hypothetical protein
MTIPHCSAWITTWLDHESRSLETYHSLSLFMMVSTWLLPTFVFWQHSNAAWKKSKSREHSGAPYHHTAPHRRYTVFTILHNFTESLDWFSSVKKSCRTQGPDILPICMPIFMLTDDELWDALLQRQLPLIKQRYWMIIAAHAQPQKLLRNPKKAKFKDHTFNRVKKWKKIHTGNPLYFQTSPTCECKLYRQRCQKRIWKQTRTLQTYVVIWASFVCFACRFLGSAGSIAWQKGQLNLWLATFNDEFYRLAKKKSVSSIHKDLI